MNTLKPVATEFRSIKDLKPVLTAQDPCLSLYTRYSSTAAAPNPKTNALEWKEIIRRIEPKTTQYGTLGRELLDSVTDWEAILPEGKPQGNSLAVFRSPDQFCVAWINGEVPPLAAIGPRFNIRPLLPELTRNAVFYILALSQKDVRLLRCTLRSAEEIPFPAGIETSFEKWMNTAKPDHMSDKMEAVAASTGNMKGVFSTVSTTGREDKDKFLGHFFRQIDRGLNELLRSNGGEPVVLAGVEYELPLYRAANSYPHLCPESVQGAPNGLKAGEMHARALEAMARSYTAKVDSLLAEYNHKAGGGASNRLKDIVTAAHDGRVLTLLVSDSLESTGVFDEATHTVKARETGSAEDEDLINDAAVQTILHAGQVFVVKNNKMPNGAPLAAVFRF